MREETKFIGGVEHIKVGPIDCPDGKPGCLVAHFGWIKKDAYDCIHDAIYEEKGFTKSQIKGYLIYRVYQNVPERIRKDADYWGWTDTEVRGEIHEWLREAILI